ncbi:pyrimidine reductase family protein [Mycolicibacterium sp. P9-22]|uniref:pyrimidine reductase family protein n=1 Tax=Mycolicibacterium sp. P9-22 TaxID=2024613 RepID=UPI0011EEA76D|nr:pyrimidine reductase family protein [Mycolicibacterium sp. P9-22]KAA0113866.1 pyrimidine reductase family protein [Mycolicibacterium sp. P9-22]
MTATIAEVGGLADLAQFYAVPPHGVRANMIFSADGAAAFAGRAGPLSNPVDQELLRTLRGFADVVLVGAGTARAENYGPVRLTEAQQAERHAEGRPDPPPIAVVSRTGNLPARLFSDPYQPPILITTERAAPARDEPADRLSRVFAAGTDAVDLVRVVELLGAAGMPRILCEGGPTLLDELVECGAVDEICVTLAPKLAASQPVRASARLSPLTVPVGMQLDHVLVHQDYVFLKYRR